MNHEVISFKFPFFTSQLVIKRCCICAFWKFVLGILAFISGIIQNIIYSRIKSCTTDLFQIAMHFGIIRINFIKIFIIIYSISSFPSCLKLRCLNKRFLIIFIIAILRINLDLTNRWRNHVDIFIKLIIIIINIFIFVITRDWFGQFIILVVCACISPNVLNY